MKRYRAFISYSHKDEKIAAKLHRYIEQFRIPKKMEMKWDQEFETIPRRIFPVFRDKDELPSSADLGTQIETALRNSDFLVVICSPDSAQSHWVNEEILTFKRMGRAANILALIVSGEPNADTKTKVPNDQECFPEGLKYAVDTKGNLQPSLRMEPIAADSRKGIGNTSDAFMKIVAGLLGVGYDELKQREIKRKQRVAYVITGGALAVVLLTGTLSIIAIKNAKAFEEQKIIAEERLALAKKNEAEAKRQEGIAEERLEEIEEQQEKIIEERNRAEENEKIALFQQSVAEKERNEALRQKSIAQNMLLAMQNKELMRTRVLRNDAWNMLWFIDFFYELCVNPYQKIYMLVTKADYYMQLNDYDKAKEALDTALSMDKNSLYVKRKYIYLYFEQEEYAKVVSTSDELFNAMEYSLYAYVNKIVALTCLGKFEEAIEVFSVLKNNYRYESHWSEFFIVDVHKDIYENTYQSSIFISVDSMLKSLKLFYYFNLFMNEDSVLDSDFREYIKTESFTFDSVLYVINWVKQYQGEWPQNCTSYLFEGMLWEMLKLEDEAFNTYEKYLASNPLLENNTLPEYENSLINGESLLDFPITISIENVETQIAIAFADRNLKELIPLLDSYLSENPEHAGFLLYKAIILFEQQKWKECIEYCDRIIELAPLTYEAYYYRTAAESWIDFDYDRVMAGLNQVSSIFPYHINTLIDKASLVEDDNPELAEELYREVLLIAPNISWVVEKVMADQ